MHTTRIVLIHSWTPSASENCDKCEKLRKLRQWCDDFCKSEMFGDFNILSFAFFVSIHVDGISTPMDMDWSCLPLSFADSKSSPVCFIACIQYTLYICNH